MKEKIRREAFLYSELNTLDRILGQIPEEDVIDRNSIEARIDVIRKQIEELELEEEMASWYRLSAEAWLRFENLVEDDG